jgi:CBS domain-containing protein
MMTARQLLNEKGHDLWTIHPNNSILEAMKIMIERDVGSLLVMSDARPMGIITERQCARSVVSTEKSLMDTMVWAIMAQAASEWFHCRTRTWMNPARIAH